jgi:hypothetical protein
MQETSGLTLIALLFVKSDMKDTNTAYEQEHRKPEGFPLLGLSLLWPDDVIQSSCEPIYLR